MTENQFLAAINQIAEEKNLPQQLVIETVEAALAAAYRKDYGDKDQIVRVELASKGSGIKVFVTKEVVKEVENEYLQITLADAKSYKKNVKVGDSVEFEVDPGEGFGRVAAQTAKQVIIQRIREAEREIIFNEYKDKEDKIINGVVQRMDGGVVFVDLGRTNGVLFPAEQMQTEKSSSDLVERPAACTNSRNAERLYELRPPGSANLFFTRSDSIDGKTSLLIMFKRHISCRKSSPVVHPLPIIIPPFRNHSSITSCLSCLS